MTSDQHQLSTSLGVVMMEMDSGRSSGSSSSSSSSRHRTEERGRGCHNYLITVSVLPRAVWKWPYMLFDWRNKFIQTSQFTLAFWSQFSRFVSKSAKKPVLYRPKGVCPRRVWPRGFCPGGLLMLERSWALVITRPNRTGVSDGQYSDKRPGSKRQKEVTEMEYYLLPESGEPTTQATPWNSAQSPNALVSFWIPRSSTMTIERSAMYAAANILMAI